MKQHKRGKSWSVTEVKVLQSLINKGLSWKDVAIKLNSACVTARTAKACKNKAQALWELIHTNSVMLFTKEDEKKTAEFLRRTLSVTIMGTSRTGKALKERAAKERAGKMKAPVGIAHVVDDAGAAEVCESGSDDWYKALPKPEVQQQAMASTVCASSEACAEACDIDFQALLAVGVALPDTTWNPYQKPYN